ncbi:MAG: XRE family transcriptional regulator [Flavobacterium psychrophilum]|nr:MAG: XRE family transcriptional regulator [Flavobacterium psychrophilum]
MRNELEALKKEVTNRIHQEFLVKFGGINRKFAKAAGCDEKTIRKLFDENQGMSLNLFFKLASALEIAPSKLLEGLEMKKEG